MDVLLEAALATLLAGMVLVVLWQVFARYVLGAPSSVTEELVRFGLIWLGLLGAGYGTGRNAHLAIDLLPRRLAGSPRIALEILAHVAVATFAFLALVVGGSRLVELTLALGQTSAALQIERGYVYLALPLSGGVMMLYTVLTGAERVATWTSREDGA